MGNSCSYRKQRTWRTGFGIWHIAQLVRLVALVSPLVTWSAEFQYLFSSFRFEDYISKSAYKMAGLPYCCQANAVLGGGSPAEAHKALLYGRHLGIAYQLVDDILDFVSLDDLKLGFASAPVFFAAQEFPQLDTMITRRLSTKRLKII